MKEKKVLSCANYILDSLSEIGVNEVTNLKLQKLLFLAYGFNLALNDKRLFDEKIQAWKFGPVILSVYNQFKTFGGDPILTRACLDIETDEGIEFVAASYNELTEEELKSLTISCMVYGKKSAWDLVDFTHNANSAWSQSYRPGIRNLEIEDELIKQEFNGYLDDVAHILLG